MLKIVFGRHLDKKEDKDIGIIKKFMRFRGNPVPVPSDLPQDEVSFGSPRRQKLAKRLPVPKFFFGLHITYRFWFLGLVSTTVAQGKTRPTTPQRYDTEQNSPPKTEGWV
jgi:hypothetical protein